MTFMEMLEQGGKVPEMDVQGYLVLTPHICREAHRQLSELIATLKKYEKACGDD